MKRAKPPNSNTQKRLTQPPNHNKQRQLTQPPIPHKQERRTQPPIPRKQQRRTKPPIPHIQQRQTKPPIPHKQQRRTKPPPLTKWNVKSHKSNQTSLQPANHIAKPRCKAGKRGVRVKGKRVQVHFERVRNELEEHREGAGGKSPLCLGFVLSPRSLRCPLCEIPTN